MSLPCKHKPKNIRFLTQHIVPHLTEPGTKSVMNFMFLCEDCGDIFMTGLEVLRGYMPDGTFPPELAAISEQKVKNAKTEMLVEARAGQLMTKRLKEMEEEARRGADHRPGASLAKAPDLPSSV